MTLVLSPGQDADVTHAESLLQGSDPEAVIGDKGYDSDAFVAAIRAKGAQPVIPPKSNRKEPRELLPRLPRSVYL